jgi:hypothetical protein
MTKKVRETLSEFGAADGLMRGTAGITPNLVKLSK